MEKPKARILIIDDEQQIRELLRDLLCEEYNCQEAASAEDALAAFDGSDFDLVLSDINMGGISGLELVPHVLERSPQTVVVMISGQQGIETAIAALKAGAFDYITKPFDLRHVEAAVRRASSNARCCLRNGSTKPISKNSSNNEPHRLNGWPITIP